MAAGFSLQAQDVEQVANAFERYAADRLTAADFEIFVNIEAEVEPSEVSFPSVQAMECLEPYGSENPEPIFAIRSMRVAKIEQTKNPLHPRLTLRAPDGTGPLVKAMAFSMGDRIAQYEEGFEAQMLIQPKIDEWKDRLSMKWEIKYLEPDPATCRLVPQSSSAEPLAAPSP